MLPREFIVSTSDVTSAVKRMIRAVDRHLTRRRRRRGFYAVAGGIGRWAVVVYQKAKDCRPCVRDLVILCSRIYKRAI